MIDFPPPPVTPTPPHEPEELKAAIRAAAEADPAGTRDRLADGRWMAEWLWPAWRQDLEAAGGTEAVLAEVAARNSRELWLWVQGERQWAEMAGLLYGGVRRRRKH